MQQEEFLEIVVYAVDPDLDFTALVSRAEKAMRTKADGMYWWSHWISPDDNSLRADVVCWATPEEAYAAAGIMDRDPEMKFFTSAITEVKHMDHYRAQLSPADLKDNLNDPGLLELAFFTSAQPEVTAANHPKLHATATSEAGCIVHQSLRSARHEDGFGGFILWTDLSAHREVAGRLTKATELQAYFGSIGKVSIFQLFVLSGKIN